MPSIRVWLDPEFAPEFSKEARQKHGWEWTQIAAQQLGIAPEKIEVLWIVPDQWDNGLTISIDCEFSAVPVFEGVLLFDKMKSLEEVWAIALNQLRIDDPRIKSIGLWIRPIFEARFKLIG